eukprot:CAMPEP_0181522580 /NCGR_PEP_ID=MMETSP1110-20121109/67448_1 /TAXON_ID=174948 /ORGANISM="Symbiodinium sp., Strain CCMP421" /LENGTH=67 /DNA_ID=CAMNT_0023653203 /DNA_START=301 /DNA_END=504 /DNA_ORIENTATION=+
MSSSDSKPLAPLHASGTCSTQYEDAALAAQITMIITNIAVLEMSSHCEKSSLSPISTRTAAIPYFNM